MKKLLIIGSAHADLAVYVDQMPKGDEDLNLENTVQRMSGSGWKNAYIFHKLGFPYQLLAPAGQGIYGEYVLSKAQEQGIELSCFSEDTNGCTYHVIDREGRSNGFCVPGAEYNFSIDYLQDLDPEEIEDIVLYGDMLKGEGTEEVIGTVQELGMPLYFAPGEAVDSLDDDLMQEILRQKPVLLLTDAEAYYLTKQNSYDLKRTAIQLCAVTEAPLMILKDGTGCYYYSEEEQFLGPEKGIMDPDLYLSAYLACRRIGMDERNSVMYACRFSADYSAQLPDERLMAYEKKRLAGMILNKQV